MGHFDFLVQVERKDVKNDYQPPTVYKLGFRECWAQLAKKVCDDKNIAGGFARLSTVFYDERCLLPGDEGHLTTGTLVVPSEHWGQGSIPHSAQPGVVQTINKAGRCCQVKWKNLKISKKCKMIGGNEANIKNMQLHKYQPLGLKLDMSPWDYGGPWDKCALVNLDITSSGGEGYIKISTLQNYIAKPSSIPPSFKELLIGYDGELSPDESSEDETTPTFVVQEIVTGKAVAVPKTRSKRPSEARVSIIGKEDVVPNKAPRLASPKRFPKSTGPTGTLPTPAAASAALPSTSIGVRKGVHPDMQPAQLAAWMEKHGSCDDLKLGAKIVLEAGVHGNMLLGWLARTDEGNPAAIAIGRKDIPFNSITFRAIRDKVREFDDSVKPSPSWPCGCSAHLSSMYSADEEPVIHLGAYNTRDIGKKFKIGRHGDSDYQLSFRDRSREIYMTISRVHTEIVLTKEGWSARDSSENGTFVNQTLVHQTEVGYGLDNLINDNWRRLANGGHLLKHGDVLSLGTAPSKNKGYVFYFFDLGG